MDEVPLIPESISHKRLNKFLSHAKKETTEAFKESYKSLEGQENIEELLENWKIISKELLKSLKNNEKYFKEAKKSYSILALGAMEAHINMALQALQASEMEE